VAQIAAVLILTSAQKVTAQPESSAAPIPADHAMPGHPDAFALAYEVVEGTTSPDGKFGIIATGAEFYPDTDAAANFIVELKPFRVVGYIKHEPYFRQKNHGGLAASWAKDGSAVLVTSEAEWAPHNITLVELREGRIVWQTELSADVTKALAADCEKCAKDAAPQSLGGKWEIDAKGRVRFDCEAESNPKQFRDEQSWAGRFRGVWSIADRKWIERKVTRTFCGKYKGDR
jgi:hypothetical protein